MFDTKNGDREMMDGEELQFIEWQFDGRSSLCVIGSHPNGKPVIVNLVSVSRTYYPIGVCLCVPELEDSSVCPSRKWQHVQRVRLRGNNLDSNWVWRQDVSAFSLPPATSSLHRRLLHNHPPLHHLSSNFR